MKKVAKKTLSNILSIRLGKLSDSASPTPTNLFSRANALAIHGLMCVLLPLLPWRACSSSPWPSNSSITLGKLKWAFTAAIPGQRRRLPQTREAGKGPRSGREEKRKMGPDGSPRQIRRESAQEDRGRVLGAGGEESPRNRRKGQASATRRRRLQQYACCPCRHHRTPAPSLRPSRAGGSQVASQVAAQHPEPGEGMTAVEDEEPIEDNDGGDLWRSMCSVQFISPLSGVGRVFFRQQGGRRSHT